jgi:integrase
MPKQAKGLTVRQVETKTAGMWADGGGLYLRVTAAGARGWIYRYQIAGRRREMGVGPYPLVTLAEARQRAHDARKLVMVGTDPIDAKRASAVAQAVEKAKAVPTFRQVAEQYIVNHRPAWRNEKHAGQWAATLATYVHPVMGDLPADEVDTPTILRVLEPLWHTKTETASRLRGRIEAVLDFAKACGHRTGENPSRWKGHLDHVLPAKGKVAPVEHHAAMPYADLPAFWPRLQAADGMGARALEFAILTACRTSEVLGARWDEIDMGAAVWTIPAARMKAGAEHRVPLTAPALALLRKMAAIREGEYVIAGQRPGKPLSGMAMAMTLRRMKVEVTPHGFRSTFRTWASEKTSAPWEVAEAALAHTLGDKTEQAYQRGDLFDRRRSLMDQWASFVTSSIAAGNVVPLSRVTA